MAASPFSNFIFRKSFFFLGITWLALHVYTLASLSIDLKTALQDGAVSVIITALSCYIMSVALAHYQAGKNKLYTLVAWNIVLAFLNTMAIKLTTSQFIDIEGYEKFLSDSLPIRFAVSFLLIGTMILICTLWYSQQDRSQYERRKSEAEKLNREATLMELREKLQPHFLFNSLNSISALILSQPYEARKMIFQLSEFLRGTIRQDQQATTLKAELEHLKLYLDIEKVRFGHRLNTAITEHTDCTEKLIPPMLLQPLVENAIKFGLYDTLDSVIISISCEMEDDLLKITVKNPFDPSTAIPLKGTGFGLNSVRKRLQLFYNRYDLLKTDSSAKEFTATIYIPQT